MDYSSPFDFLFAKTNQIINSELIKNQLISFCKKMCELYKVSYVEILRFNIQDNSWTDLVAYPNSSSKKLFPMLALDFSKKLNLHPEDNYFREFHQLKEPVLHELNLLEVFIFPIEHEHEVNGSILFAWSHQIKKDDENLTLLKRQTLAILDLILRDFINQTELNLVNNNLRIWEATAKEVLPLLKSSKVTRKQICELIADVYGYRFVSIWMVDKNKNELFADAQIGFPDSVSNWRVKIGGNGIVATTAIKKKPTVIADVSKCSYYVESSPLVRSELAIPLLLENEVYAVFDLQSDVLNDFDEKTVQFMVALAHLISETIFNSIIYEEKREEEARLNIILENINEAIVTIDKNRKIIHANKEFRKFIKNSFYENPIGFPIELVLGEDNLIANFVNEVITKKPEQFSKNLQYENKIYKASVNFPEYSSRNIGAIVLLHDITREAEVNKMKTELVSHVSHDLRTPLTSLVGFASTSLRDLDRHVLPSIEDLPNSPGLKAANRIRRDLLIMKEEGNRLAELITNWLDIQKIEEGKFEWEFRNVSLGYLANTVSIRMGGMSKEKGIPIIIEFDNDVMVYCDEGGIIRVMTNIISNALKYSSTGKITVRVKHKDERFGLIEVQDEGEGIPEHNLPRIFEKFQRVNSVYSKSQKGTGLGLSICKEIVENHGGEIWIESQTGVGTCVFFTLPKQKPLTTELDFSHGQINNLRGTAVTILIVDDEINIRRFIETALEDLNCEIIMANDGISAIQKVKETMPDLIILDINMEPMSGIDVMQIIVNDPSLSKVHVLILTIVDLDKGIREKMMAHQLVTFLQKPIEPNILEDTVLQILSSKKIR